MTEEKIKENAERFDELLRETGRDGIEDLIRWMHESGFYTAPASTRYHLAEPGGLLQHSLNIWDCYAAIGDGLEDYLDNIIEKKCNMDRDRMYNSSVICCLLHDLCKVGLYTEENGVYRYNKVVGVEGHGIRSIALAARYIQLTPYESEAIVYHMGLWDNDDRKEIGDVYGENMIAFLLHAADEAATFIVEK